MLGSAILCTIIGLGYKLTTAHLDRLSNMQQTTSYNKMYKVKFVEKEGIRTNIAHQIMTAFVYCFTVTALTIMILAQIIKNSSQENEEKEDPIQTLFDLAYYFNLDQSVCRDILSAILLSSALYAGTIIFELRNNQ